MGDLRDFIFPNAAISLCLELDSTILISQGVGGGKPEKKKLSNPCKFFFTSVIVQQFVIYPIVVNQLGEGQFLLLILGHDRMQLTQQPLATFPPLLY